ncbi:MAG: hypothetical protein N3B21_18820 [Clostridia bacterium]|nr:hypothetical protein [Clostridia bacterium]
MRHKKQAMENDIKQISEHIFKILSKEEIEKIAREVGFVKRQGRIKAWHFLHLCAFLELDISKHTLVTMSSPNTVALPWLEYDISIILLKIHAILWNLCPNLLL